MTPFSVFIAFPCGRAQMIQKRNVIILKTEKKISVSKQKRTRVDKA